MTSATGETAKFVRFREPWEAARQCMDVCSNTETHLKQEKNTIDDYMNGDAVQFMV